MIFIPSCTFESGHLASVPFGFQNFFNVHCGAVLLAMKSLSFYVWKYLSFTFIFWKLVLLEFNSGLTEFFFFQPFKEVPLSLGLHYFWSQVTYHETEYSVHNMSFFAQLLSRLFLFAFAVWLWLASGLFFTLLGMDWASQICKFDGFFLQFWEVWALFFQILFVTNFLSSVTCC